MRKWFEMSYKRLRKTVEFVQEQRKLREKQMWVAMHCGSFFDAMERIEDIFREYPYLKLQRSRMFRAWYKDRIDYMSANQDIYPLKFSDGSAYDKDRDKYYDPKASEWEGHEWIK